MKNKKVKKSNKKSEELNSIKTEELVKTDKKDKIKDKAKKSELNKSRIVLTATVIVIMIILGLIAYVLNTIIKKQNYSQTNPIVTIEVENFGTIKAELYPQYAPNTVSNFIYLANSGFYNGLTFHRTIPDFMIQGGDPNGDGTGNAKLSNLGDESTDKYAISGEFILNGYTQNSLKLQKGVLAMARSDYSSQGSTSLTKKGYNSASCQFFIMTQDNSSIDGAYAGFGKVIEGQDIVDKISNVEVQTRDKNTTDNTLTADKPTDPPVMKTVSVETWGVDYGKPETIEPFDYYSYMMQQYYGSNSTNQ